MVAIWEGKKRMVSEEGSAPRRHCCLLLLSAPASIAAQAAKELRKSERLSERLFVGGKSVALIRAEKAVDWSDCENGQVGCEGARVCCQAENHQMTSKPSFDQPTGPSVCPMNLARQ